MVDFRQLNLLTDFAALGQFDVVFCRNVLIYFDAPTKARRAGRLAARLTPDGAIVLGAAETVIGLTDTLAPHPGASRPLRACRRPQAQRRAAAAARRGSLGRPAR